MERSIYWRTNFPPRRRRRKFWKRKNRKKFIVVKSYFCFPNYKICRENLVNRFHFAVSVREKYRKVKFVKFVSCPSLLLLAEMFVTEFKNKSARLEIFEAEHSSRNQFFSNNKLLFSNHLYGRQNVRGNILVLNIGKVLKDFKVS